MLSSLHILSCGLGQDVFIFIQWETNQVQLARELPLHLLLGQLGQPPKVGLATSQKASLIL